MSETIGAITRWFFSLLKRDSKPFKYFYDPLWMSKMDMDDRLEINSKNRKIGFLVIIIFIVLIYFGFFNFLEVSGFIIAPTCASMSDYG